MDLLGYRAHPRPRSHFKTPKDLLLAQINELQRHFDSKNIELVQLVEKETQLLAATSRSEEVDPKMKEQEDIVKQQQLSGFAMKKDLLLKKIAFIEEDILKKRKEAGIV